MKKGIKISGIVSANLVLLGTVLKLIHIPLATIIILVGITCTATWFIPLVVLEVKRKQQAIYPLILLAAVATIVNLGSSIFVLSHWPFRNIAVFIGVFTPLILVLPMVVYYYAKTNQISLKQFVIIMAVFLVMAVLDTFLSINYTKEFVQGSQVIHRQLIALNKTFADNTEPGSDVSKELRELLAETRNEIGYEKLDHSWPAEKVLWMDNYSYRIQELLKAYNSEVVELGFRVPDDFNTSPRKQGKRLVPWREFYLGSPKTFEALDRLSRIELYLNQTDFKLKFKLSE